MSLERSINNGEPIAPSKVFREYLSGQELTLSIHPIGIDDEVPTVDQITIDSVAGGANYPNPFPLSKNYSVA